MADLKATFYSDNYIPDREDTPAAPTGGGTAPKSLLVVKGSFVVPPGMQSTLANGILDKAKLTKVAFNGVKASSSVPPACAMRGLFSPRRVRFYLDSGHSFSIPIIDRGQLISIAGEIKTLVDTAAGVGKVICAKLIGEEWVNLVDVLATVGNPTAVPPVVGKPAITPASADDDPRGNTFSAAYLYESDSGGEIVRRHRIESDKRGAPPTLFKSAWEAGNDSSTNRTSCAGQNRRYIPRYYTASFLVMRNSVERVSKSQIPVSENEASTIKSVGLLLADNASVSCLKYNGESDNFFHLAIK